MKSKWYERKDGVYVYKVGNYKVLELDKKINGFWVCFVFERGTVVAGNGYHSSSLPRIENAKEWGMLKAKELKIIK